MGAESQEEVGDRMGAAKEGGAGSRGNVRWKLGSTCPVWSRYKLCKLARMSVACWRRRCNCVRAIVVRWINGAGVELGCILDDGLDDECQ